jgi:predicted GNAT family N-acyltransferase
MVQARDEQDPAFALPGQVEENSRAFSQTGLGFDALQQSILQVEQNIFSFDGDGAGAAMVLGSYSPATVSALNRAYRIWETALESDFAARVVEGRAALQDYLLYKRFESLVRRELALVAAYPLKRLLYVGTGPLPISAILAHLQTGLLVDCIARDEHSQIAATQVVESCGLGKSVRVFAGDCAKCDFSPYDLVLIEIQWEPGSGILKRLRKRCKSGCQILYRTANGLRRLIYPDTLECSPHGFEVKGWQIARGEQTVSTCLLETAVSAAAQVNLKWLTEIESEMASQILRLMNRTLEEETTIGFPGPIDDHTGAVLMRQLDADVKARRRHVLIAEKDGKVVGQVILTPNSSPNQRHIVELTRGTIDRSFRGAGLALQAFHEVGVKCDELGREVICLDVRRGTMAAIWWQHFGFQPYGCLEDYSRVGERKYAGLYLSQTTASLKQRLCELAKSRTVPSLATGQ